MGEGQSEVTEKENPLMRPSHRRLREFEFFDDIHLHIVERWKESHMSGNEWRFSIHADFFFKGHLLFTLRFMNMDHALATIAGKHDSMDSGYGDRDGNDVSTEILQIEKDLCDQPGCKEKAVHKFRLERIYSKCGSFSKEAAGPESISGGYYYQFCEKHCHRGDCALEDSDANLAKMEMPDG